MSAEWALEGEGIGNSSGSSMSRVRSGVGPAGPWEARVLSGNAWSPVQAMAIKGRCTGDGVKSDFWATQYHTEFSLKDVAQLTTLALPLLVKQVGKRKGEEGQGRGTKSLGSARDHFSFILKLLLKSFSHFVLF